MRQAFYATNISSFNQDPQQPTDGFPDHSIFPDKHEQEIIERTNAGKKIGAPTMGAPIWQTAYSQAERPCNARRPISERY